MKDTKGEKQEINSIQAEIIKMIILLYRWSKINQDAIQIIFYKQ